MWPCDRISGSLYCHLAFHCTHLPLRIHSPVEGNLHEYKFSFCLDKYVEVRFLGLMLSFPFIFLCFLKKLLLFFSFKKKMSKKLPNTLPKWLFHFAFHQRRNCDGLESACVYLGRGSELRTARALAPPTSSLRSSSCCSI